MRSALMTTNLSLPDRRSGKVRDIYSVPLANGESGILIVATDRISAFDVVMANGLPGKGIVLTQISRFWFEHFAGSVKHHLISTDIADVPGLTAAERKALAGRIMLCRQVDVIPIECIARGYITGSGWKDYQKTGAVCGIPLPKGLRNGDRLPEPIFTPSTKAETGHDENVSFDQGAEIVGADLMRWLSETTLDLYERAAAYAMERGIILADTKFEFGHLTSPHEGADLIWIDEALTPDSSRFWPAAEYKPGGAQPSFDKQYVRDYLERIQWNKTPPGPGLPPDVVTATRAKYREAFHILTGKELD